MEAQNWTDKEHNERKKKRGSSYKKNTRNKTYK
jgi:hypothetical protein